MADDWFAGVEVVVAAAYVHAPVFDLKAALVHTADHQVVSVPVGHHTCCRDLVYALGRAKACLSLFEHVGGDCEARSWV